MTAKQLARLRRLEDGLFRLHGELLLENDPNASVLLDSWHGLYSLSRDLQKAKLEKRDAGRVLWEVFLPRRDKGPSVITRTPCRLIRTYSAGQSLWNEAGPSDAVDFDLAMSGGA